MGFKERGYDRDASVQRVRDYSLFAIVCEGTKREPQYFSPFRDVIDRLKVDIIENEEGDRSSSPKSVLQRAQNYIEKVGLSEKDGDTLWLVVDVDKWKREQLDDLNTFCEGNPNWNVLVSNPCFEVWLLYHKQEKLEGIDCSTSCKVKQSLDGLNKNSYYYLDYLPLLETAVKNAKAGDSNPEHYYPNLGETKVYLLGEALLKCIGIARFKKFVEQHLPTLRPIPKRNSPKKKRF